MSGFGVWRFCLADSPAVLIFGQRYPGCRPWKASGSAACRTPPPHNCDPDCRAASKSFVTSQPGLGAGRNRSAVVMRGITRRVCARLPTGLATLPTAGGGMERTAERPELVCLDSPDSHPGGRHCGQRGRRRVSGAEIGQTAKRAVFGIHTAAACLPSRGKRDGRNRMIPGHTFLQCRLLLSSSVAET